MTTIDLPWTSPPLSSNRVRGNPYAQAARVKAALNDARIAVKAAHIPWMAGAEITLHFRPKNRHRRDADGLYPVLKVVQDALVQEGVLTDDSWVEVPAATCRIHPPTADGPAFWVELRDVGAVGTAPDNGSQDTTTRVGPGPKVLATPAQGLADRKDTTDS